MRALLRLCLLALALTTGCGQKGPLTLRPVHSKAAVAAPVAPAAIAPPATTAPADAPGQATPSTPASAPVAPNDSSVAVPPAPRT